MLPALEIDEGENDVLALATEPAADQVDEFLELLSPPTLGPALPLGPALGQRATGCMGCGRPPTTSLIRTDPLLVDPAGRPVAEVAPRIDLCRHCYDAMVSGERPLPAVKVVKTLAT